MLAHLIFELEITWRSTYAINKVYQLLALGRRWFSPGTPASSTIKTRRHDIAEILLKVALNTKNQKKIGALNLWLTDHLISVYFMESPSIQCHNMKDPTHLYSFNYFINTKK